MGLDAEVIAIGPFSQCVLNALEYGPNFYSNVEEGVLVIVHVFLACNSENSHLLASAFGVGAMDLGKHHLSAQRANLSALREAFGESNVRQFLTLRDNGFDFYYAPNA